MLKCPNTLDIYYSQQELKHFGLKVLAVYRMLEHFSKLDKKSFEFIKCLCSKLFWIFLNIYFGTNVSKKSDKKKISTMLKWLDIHKYFWTISSLYVS